MIILLESGFINTYKWGYLNNKDILGSEFMLCILQRQYEFYDNSVAIAAKNLDSLLNLLFIYLDVFCKPDPLILYQTRAHNTGAH